MVRKATRGAAAYQKRERLKAEAQAKKTDTSVKGMVPHENAATAVYRKPPTPRRSFRTKKSSSLLTELNWIFWGVVILIPLLLVMAYLLPHMADWVEARR